MLKCGRGGRIKDYCANCDVENCELRDKIHDSAIRAKAIAEIIISKMSNRQYQGIQYKQGVFTGSDVNNLVAELLQGEESKDE